MHLFTYSMIICFAGFYFMFGCRQVSLIDGLLCLLHCSYLLSGLRFQRYTLLGLRDAGYDPFQGLDLLDTFLWTGYDTARY
ncbi:uncharacterized protein Dyak_GE28330 [Drosophila yakuba]|uniref:Uncharacterized protein n=1 Tax=Drosophila yakuba TaxID=7245 RepID=A0A0R1EEC9_DROYA|nr:uncharacterized protein Dyak_GE28330 [Drosophila yakuba]